MGGSRTKLSGREEQEIERCLEWVEESRPLFKALALGFVEACGRDELLEPNIHLMKHRLKSPDRIRSKLARKVLESKRNSMPVTVDNLTSVINDIAGVRIVHLYTGELAGILAGVKRVIAREQYAVVEQPTGHCWDVEYEDIYRACGVEPRSRNSMYSSVHLVLGANKHNPLTFEVQIRTLAEELWGEVSHTASYELEKPDRLVEQQLRVLARMTSGATRLIDCIFERLADTGSGEGS